MLLCIGCDENVLWLVMRLGIDYCLCLYFESFLSPIYPVASRSYTQYLITFSFTHANTTFATLTIQPCVFYCDSHEYARCYIRIRMYNINISPNCIALHCNSIRVKANANKPTSMHGIICKAQQPRAICRVHNVGCVMNNCEKINFDASTAQMKIVNRNENYIKC